MSSLGGRISAPTTALYSVELFQHLKLNQIQCGPLRLSQVFPVINIHSLQILKLRDVDQPDPSRYHWPGELIVSPRSSPLEELYVEHSYIGSRSLAQLIGSVKALRRFCLEFNREFLSKPRLHNDGPPSPHDPAITATLLEHKKSLQELNICEDTNPYS
jgi:hypothetical protein